MYKTFNNVELEEVYKKLSDVTDKYLFKLEYREKEENRGIILEIKHIKIC